MPKNVLVLFFLLAATGVRAQQPHFNHTTIYVTDLARASAFYHNVMLLDTISEPFKDGKHTWFKIGEHSQLHVVSGSLVDIPHDINIHLAFSVPDLSVFTHHLDTLNIPYGNWNQTTKTPQLRPDGIKQVYLQDPDGYWIEVDDSQF